MYRFGGLSCLQNHCEAQAGCILPYNPEVTTDQIVDTFCKAIAGCYPCAYTTHFSEFFTWFKEVQDRVFKAFIKTVVHHAIYVITIKQITAFTHRYRTYTRQTGSTNTQYHAKIFPQRSHQKENKNSQKSNQQVALLSLHRTEENIFLGSKCYGQILYWVITQVGLIDSNGIVPIQINPGCPTSFPWLLIPSSPFLPTSSSMPWASSMAEIQMQHCRTDRFMY